MAKKYVVQGSPGKYEVKEAKTQEEIKSGMTYAAALQTANSLNANADKDKKGEASKYEDFYGVDEQNNVMNLSSPDYTSLNREGVPAPLNLFPNVKSSDISQVIKNVYLKNGWSKKDIDSYFQGKPLQVSTAWLLQDIKDGTIKMPSSLPGEKDAFANLEANLAEARSKGESKYLNQYNLSLPKRPELPEKRPEKEEEETKEDVGTVEEKRDVGRTEYPKTLINKQGDSTTAKSGVEEAWARQAGYDKEPKDFTLSQGINLLRKYEQGKDFFVSEKEKAEIEIEVVETNLKELKENNQISQDEFNAFNKFLGNSKDKINEEYEITKPKEGDTKVENGITFIFQNGEWVIYETPDSDEGPKEGDTKVENGITYIFQNGEWVVLPTGAEGGGQEGGGEQQEGNAGDIYDFLNIPEGAYLWDVDGTNYIVYEVPGSNGELYEGNPIFMAYEVQENDVIKAGIYSPEGPTITGAPVSKVFFDKIAIVTGNTDQLSADIDNPFASFVETIGEQALVAPWIKDPEMLSLIAEAAVEGRVVTDAEWQVTDWYQEHNDSEREWLRTYYSDPSTAAQLTTDSQLAVANSLQASGVSNAPEALVNWVAGKYISGEWSDTYTAEQIALFSDPYAAGKRDAQFENYLSSTAITGVDRTTAREKEVEELFATWLGPTLGKLTDQEKSEMAGRLRDDPDYKDTLIGSLKQSRLAAFSNYTNPELTYDDIARPWRNLTTSVWGQTADETQGWWQEMVKSNDFATAQTTLREKGLENNVTQVTQDATQALTQALSQGQVSQGVNQ